MHYQALLVAYFCSTAAALPLSSKTTRQSLPGLSGLSFPGLGSGTGTGSGLPALPSGLPSLGGDAGGLPSLPSGNPGLGGDETDGGLGGLGDLLSGLGGGTGSGTPSFPGLGGDSTSSDAESDASPPSSSSPITTAASAAGCKAVTVIFARGTTEPSKLGMVVGPKLNTAVGKALNNNAVVTGVAYAASAGGIATEIGGKGGAGTKAMVKAVTAALASCPDTKVVLSGYSQGAMLVHNTMNNLDAAQAAKVKAAVTFGDPFVGQAVKGVPKGAFKSFCASADSVCAAGVGTSPSAGGTRSASASGHLGYGADVTAAADFIKGMVSV
ncbi:cutinase [Diaporthe helianthi]|uniref:Cutinase n=1 Tax=Diaporthe helianthi TaxID=158607 RepID=A0A2P5HJM6_DIAHE|nr:cutinase [Diaporthe helianthi]